MAEKKTGAAKHSADYRDRKKAEAERLKPIANGAYWRNKILARQPAIDTDIGM